MSTNGPPFPRAPALDMMGKRNSSYQKRIVSKIAVHERDDFNMLLFASFCLCFNAGMVNVITMSSFLQVTTAHVTGLVARSSIMIADANWSHLYLPITTYLSFLLGCIVAGYTVSYETFYLGRTYGQQLIMIASLQAIALLIDTVQAGSISDAVVHHNYIYACAVGCGLQNGMTSKYSGNTIRTTHLTGATTDLGIAIGHCLKGRLGELWKIKLHSVALVGFLAGGILGRIGYNEYQEGVLVANVVILALLGVAHTLYIAYHEQLPVSMVAKSRVDIKIHHHIPIKDLDDESRLQELRWRREASQRNLERIKEASNQPMLRFSSSRSMNASSSSSLRDIQPIGSGVFGQSSASLSSGGSMPHLEAMSSKSSLRHAQGAYPSSPSIHNAGDLLIDTLSDSGDSFDEHHKDVDVFEVDDIAGEEEREVNELATADSVVVDLHHLSALKEEEEEEEAKEVDVSHIR